MNTTSNDKIKREGDAERKKQKKLRRTPIDQGESTTSSSSASLRTDASTAHSGPAITNPTLQQLTLTLTATDRNPSSKKMQDMSCGSCLFCRMPACERCYICLANAALRQKGQREEGACLRKMCVIIPIELKLQPADKLGFPGWRFGFDDPQKALLVLRTKRIMEGLAGLKLVSPEGAVHHSLESAFAHVARSPHRPASPEAETDRVEKFLAHVGSSPYRSKSHFLVDKSYCHEFTGRHGGNIVLFGRIIACMGLPPAGGKSGKDGNACFFVIRYDRDVLAIAQQTAGTEIPPVQLIRAEAAWGGCISYERKTCCRRTSLEGGSAIQNIDQATAAETWIAPDLRAEGTAPPGADGTDLPALTVVARGYKFAFQARVDGEGAARRVGVFASCAPLREGGAHQEINLKPGELVDLGALAPGPGEETALAAFVVKNYVHKFKLGRWAVAAGRDDAVHDLADDCAGTLRAGATRRALSYVRKRSEGEFPAIHARMAPDMRVHLLFGIPYEGNWSVYEAGMQGLVPLFSGREVEVTTCRHYGLGSKHVAGAKYLQSMSMFQAEDILAGHRQLECMFESAEAIARLPASRIGRAKKVLECLVARTQNLLDMFANAEDQEDSHAKSPLVSVLESLQKLMKTLEGHGK